MSVRYDESEYVFCDLQAIYRYLRQDDEPLARRFLLRCFDLSVPNFLPEEPNV
jgi:hypothetical protein